MAQIGHKTTKVCGNCGEGHVPAVSGKRVTGEGVEGYTPGPFVAKLDTATSIPRLNDKGAIVGFEVG